MGAIQAFAQAECLDHESAKSTKTTKREEREARRREGVGALENRRR
jgi:hypothetical protein